MTDRICNLELIRFAVLKARQKISASQHDIQNGFYDDAVSRSYYAVFHSISAVLSVKGLSFSSHSQTIGAFNKHFVKEGIFPEHITRMIKKLIELREIGDYSWTKAINEETARLNLKNAELIVNLCQTYIENHFHTKLSND